MIEITFTKEEVDGILSYLNDNPAKFSNPLLNLFGKKINEAQQLEQARSLIPTPEPPTEQELKPNEDSPTPKKRGVVKKLRDIQVNGEEDLSKNNVPNG
jgi:hypothetical protein